MDNSDSIFGSNVDISQIKKIDRDEETVPSTPAIDTPQGGDGEVNDGQPAAEIPENKVEQPGTEPNTQDPDAGTPENKDEASKPEAEPGKDTSTETPETKPTEPDFDSLISEKTDGRIASYSSLSDVLDEYDQLKEQVSKKPEIEFPSERAKKAYDYLIENQGEFKDLSRQYHQILSLDVDNLDGKDAQREAFILKRTDLSRDKAIEVFEARHKSFVNSLADLEEDEKLIKQDEFDEKTSEAKKFLKEQRENVYAEVTKEEPKPEEAPQGPTKEELEQQALEAKNNLLKDIDKRLNGFDSIEIKFGDGDKIPDGVVTKKLEPEKIQSLKNAMADPGDFIRSKIQEMTDQNGQIDWNEWANFMYWVSNEKEIKNMIASEGYVKGQLAKLAESKNLDTQPAPEVAGQQEESLFGAWAKARKN